MVQVNKLRKTIGRLQVKVALSIHSRPPEGLGGGGGGWQGQSQET